MVYIYTYYAITAQLEEVTFFIMTWYDHWHIDIAERQARMAGIDLDTSIGYWTDWKLRWWNGINCTPSWLRGVAGISYIFVSKPVCIHKVFVANSGWHS